MQAEQRRNLINAANKKKKKEKKEAKVVSFLHVCKNSPKVQAGVVGVGARWDALGSAWPEPSSLDGPQGAEPQTAGERAGAN